MVFEEALRLVKAGAKVQRTVWGEGSYLLRGELRTGPGALVSVIFRHYEGHPHVETYEPSSSELFASDWVMLEGPPNPCCEIGLGAGDVRFHTGTLEVLRFTPEGDIFVLGRFAENDAEVVAGVRAFLTGQLPPPSPSTGEVRFTRVLRDEEESTDGKK